MIGPGPGQVVMAAWHHVTEDPLVALSIRGPPRFDAVQGQLETIHCTAGHRFFSVTRQDWVSASELEIGETLWSGLRKQASGVQVVAKQYQTPTATPVHNLSIEQDHQFLVANANVLAHNMSKSKKDADCETNGGSGTTHGVPNNPGTVRRFMSRSEYKEMRRNGWDFDPERSEGGMSATSTSVRPRNPDRLRNSTGAEHADYYLDINTSDKEVFIKGMTKGGVPDYKIRSSITPDDINPGGRVSRK